MPASTTALRAIVGTLILVFAVRWAPAQAGAVPLAVQAAAGCPATIAFGQALSCSLSALGEVDSFNFTADPNDHVLVRMARLTGGISPHIQVLSVGFTTPICEKHSNTATVEISDCLLASGGSYTIQASDYAGAATGDYVVSLQRVNNPAGASALSLGQTQQATITAAGELDSYTFAGAANDIILVRMGSSAAALNPHMRLYTPDGTSLCEGSGLAVAQEIASCQLPSDGQYTLVVSDYAGVDTGGYGIVVQRLTSPGNAAALAFGQTAPAAIDGPGEVDTYTFAAGLADTVVVRVGSVASPFTPHIRLYGTDGTMLCERFSAGLATDTGGCLLPSSGTYTVLVNDYGGADTGSYGIALQRVNNPAQAQALAFGQLHTADLTAPGQLATYTFTANNGDSVLLRMGGAAGGIAPQIRVFGPGGNLICNANGALAAVEIPGCSMPAIATYTVLVNDYNHATTGSYGLTIQRLNNPANVTALLINQTASGAITAPGQLATYTFVAKAGSPVRVVMSSPASDFFPSIRLYKPDGVLLCQAGGSPGGAEIASCLLPSDETYTLVATNFNGAGSGSYALVALCLAADCGPSIPLSYVYLPLARR